MKQAMLAAVFLVAVPTVAASQTKAPDCSTQEGCRTQMLNEALEKLFAQLKDPYSAKLDSIVIVTHTTPLPVVCGRVNAKNAFGAYAGMKVFLYYLLSGTDVVFPEAWFAAYNANTSPDPMADVWKPGIEAAMEACSAAMPADLMKVPPKYAKYVSKL